MVYRFSNYNRLFLTYQYPEYIHYNECNQFEPVRSSSVHYNAIDYVTAQTLFHYNKSNVHFFYHYIHNSSLFDKKSRERMMLMYEKVQTFKLSFSSFMLRVKKKVSKSFNTHNLSYLPFSKHHICIYESKRIYRFDILELYKIIESCFNYDSYHIPEILKVKNPYTNLPFSFYNLIFIHFELLKYGKVSTFFILYFKSNFKKQHILDQYHVHLYINCLKRKFNQLSEKRKERILFQMLSFHMRYKHFSNIPKKKLHDLFDSIVIYFYIYNNLNQNSDDDIENYVQLYQNKYKKRLEYIFQKNPTLGRKIYNKTIDGHFVSCIDETILTI